MRNKRRKLFRLIFRARVCVTSHRRAHALWVKVPTNLVNKLRAKVRTVVLLAAVYKRQWTVVVRHTNPWLLPVSSDQWEEQSEYRASVSVSHKQWGCYFAEYTHTCELGAVSMTRRIIVFIDYISATTSEIYFNTCVRVRACLISYITDNLVIIYVFVK